MRENDPRAELAFAIMREILKRCYSETIVDPEDLIDSDGARHALIICLAMLIEADFRLSTDRDLRQAASLAGQELMSQLQFMRQQSREMRARPLDILAESSFRLHRAMNGHVGDVRSEVNPDVDSN